MMRYATSRRLTHRGKNDGLTWPQRNPTMPPKKRNETKKPNRAKRRRLNPDRRPAR